LYSVGWVFAIIIACLVVFGPYENAYRRKGKHFSKAENLLYGSLNEFSWSLALAWVLYACHNGFAGTI